MAVKSSTSSRSSSTANKVTAKSSSTSKTSSSTTSASKLQVIAHLHGGMEGRGDAGFKHSKFHDQYGFGNADTWWVSPSSTDHYTFNGPASTTLTLSPVLSDSVTSNVDTARESYIAKAGWLYNLDQMFDLSSSSTTPATLTVTFYDRDNYAGYQTYAYGTLIGSDGETYRAGQYTLTFTLQDGEYVTSSGMTLADYTFKASSQENRVQTVTLSSYDSSGNGLGTQTVDIVTRASTTDSTAGVATASEIAAMALSYVGTTWNVDGCWVLASAIAASCGVSLNLNSGWVSASSQQDNGQMEVIYNASDSQSSTWSSSLQVGDMVECGWLTSAGGGGHIFTISRISNGVTYLVDNSGARSSSDTVTTDCTVAETTLSSYLSLMDESTVVVYRIDSDSTVTTTNVGPTVAATATATRATASCSLSASSLFSCTDADGDTITTYKFYDESGDGYFTLNGTTQTSGSWFTVAASSLSSLVYVSSATTGSSDEFQVMAYDGTDWSNTASSEVVTLASQTSQADESSHSLGSLDSLTSLLSSSEWIGSGDRSDSWTFTVSSTYDFEAQLSDTTAQATLSLVNSSGATVLSATAASFDTNNCVLTSSLSAGTYTLQVTGTSSTYYDLDVGSTSLFSSSTSTSSDSTSTTTGTSSDSSLVSSAVSYKLSSTMRSLTLTGSSAINGTGNSLNNVLTGNSGSNTLTGGTGADTLTGSSGKDIFRYTSTSEGGDTITDFTSGQDKIQLVKSGFSGLSSLVSGKSYVTSTSALKQNTASLYYNSSTGVLSYHAAGTSTSSLTTIATLSSGHRSLSISDVQLVSA